MSSIALTLPDVRQSSNPALVLRYFRRSKVLGVGVVVMGLLGAFTLIGFLVFDSQNAYPIFRAQQEAAKSSTPGSAPTSSAVLC